MRTLFLAIAAALAVASFGAASPAMAAKDDITITARNFAFSPAVVHLQKGKTYELHLASKDNPHGLSVPGIGLGNVVITRTERTVTITPKKAGTFAAPCEVYCGIGHTKMKMTFIVK